MTRPLSGIRVIEMAGIGPAPFCAMMLADMGAEVIRIDRHGDTFLGGGGTVIERGRHNLILDLKQDEAKAIVKRLLAQADVLIEPYRPGVMERLGLGPEDCWAINPKLVYGRMTGWGQDGPLAKTAGHDINYIAVSGALHAMGQGDEPPSPPLHLVGDMGGGAMMLAYGIVCALFESQRSQKGQVVDAAITSGASLISTMYYALMKQGLWNVERDANLLDGGAPFYRCYRCADDKFIAIGAIEPQFYQLLVELCGVQDLAIFQEQMNRALWPQQKQAWAELFATKTQAQWCEILEGTDACFSPVLDFNEAVHYAHHQARASFQQIDGIACPAPGPILSRTPATAGEVHPAGAHTAAILQSLGYSAEEIQGFRERKVCN
ncbi:CaiB/BaiF CoA transferase family protein [Oligella urethralis]|uniref:Crotonobetainyl-CoA:carnitine CoA-transferase n=1 Tax=Oligella urethralis TaxID=90245 RepID=A0A2X1WGB2_9BURK|nr:CaiB/BaiF CoA-transferase family protein [Oligella urethralis]SPY07734.1 Crotonobetainyl-CoA:carnitine CoA-transferase [Oligella urethralis]